MTTTLIGLCLAIVVVSVLGGLLPLSRALDHTRLQVYLSFSAGVMLGASFFHMMPEAVRVGTAATIPWTAAGLLTLFFVERFFSFHHHETHAESEHAKAGGPAGTHAHDHEAHPGHPPHAQTRQVMPWGATAMGLAFHSLVGGVALASAVFADHALYRGLGSTSVGVFLATLAHKPADALTITALLVRGGSSRLTGHLVNLGFAMMIPLGAILFALGVGGMGHGSGIAWTAAALAFSAGTFLCVALSDILPELHFHSHDRLKLSVALLLGLLLMAASSMFEPGEPGPASPAPRAINP